MMVKQVFFLLLCSLLLVGVRSSGAGMTITYVSQCDGSIDLYHSTTGKIATLGKGQSVTQHYDHDLSFNVKVGSQGKTLVEIATDSASFYDLDWYDISIIVGYDYPVKIDAPGTTDTACLDVVCHDANAQPPQVYRVWNDDSATHSCVGNNQPYIVTWCPDGGSGTPSSSSSTTGSPPPPPSGSPPASGYLQSKSTGKYITLDGNSNLVATATSTSSATQFTFTANQYGYTIKAAQFVSADNYGANPLVANRPTADTWESFVFVQDGSYWEIKSYINNNYVAVQSNNQLQATQATSGTIPDSARFSIV